MYIIQVESKGDIKMAQISVSFPKTNGVAATLNKARAICPKGLPEWTVYQYAILLLAKTVAEQPEKVDEIQNDIRGCYTYIKSEIDVAQAKLVSDFKRKFINPENPDPNIQLDTRDINL